MTRTKSRELAFELLYSIEIQKLPLEEQKEQIELFLQEQNIEVENAKEYITNTITGVIQNEEEINKKMLST